MEVVCPLGETRRYMTEPRNRPASFAHSWWLYAHLLNDHGLQPAEAAVKVSEALDKAICAKEEQRGMERGFEPV